MSKAIQAPQAPSESAAVLSMIERVACDPGSDIAKLEKMLDMQERVLNRRAREEFSADMAAMQVELPRIARNGKGHNDKRYALLEDINDEIRPVLQRHGFAITFRIKQEDARITVTTVLSHRGGHFEETDLTLPADTTGSKNAVQAIGSTVSYGKRYGICALLNISTGDDDDASSFGQPDALMASIGDLVNATSLEQLQAVFTTAWNTHRDAKSRQALARVKDQRKKELGGVA